MKRKQIYLDEEMDRLIHKWSVVKGVSEASLIREAVGEYLSRIEKMEDPGPDNPLLKMIGFCEEETHPDSAANHDRFLYGKDRD